MGIIDKLASILGSKASKQGSVQRNDPCWCGSGRKYKKCHYEDDRKRSFGKAVKKKPS
jgi:hypothetical protein